MSPSVVVVTGGGRGIGRAVCQRFAGEGAQTVAAARSVEELAETKRLIEQSGGLCHVEPTDLSEADEIQALAETTLERFGRIDVLVNCAGVAPLVTIEELDDHVFETILAVNVTAVYLGCRAVWPIMKRQRGGVIVNISSIASVSPYAGFAAYGASKAWVNAWTNALAEEGRPHGIHVFSIAPGAVETKMLRNVFPDYPAADTLAPSDVADLVYAVTRPECQYTTGQTIFAKKS
jgi:3-oxoacyl-[acyl-carrier protein] reductase